MKTITLKYVTETKAGSFEYRRQVPVALRELLGGLYEFKKVLGRSETAAIRAYPAYHEFVEKQLEEAKRPSPKVATIETIRTTMDDWRDAVARLKALGIDPTGPLHREYDGAAAYAEFTPADALAENWQVRDRADSIAFGMLNSNGNAKPPEPTFVDAAKLYVKTKVDGEGDERRKRQRVDRVTDIIKTALGKDPKLCDLTRPHAREVVAEMLSSEISPATVDRYCNDIRAIISFGIREFQLERRAINPFVKIDIKGLRAVEKADRDERNPFTKDQLKASRAYVLAHAGPELRWVWRLLEMTGLRVSEATGLEIQDVVTQGDLPHIDIRFNDIRRLKNKASIRKVPLVGDALTAAQEALSAAAAAGRAGKPDAPLFPLYGRERGGDAASAALMKNVRKVVTDPKVTVHSLRHNMQDRLIAKGVSEHDRHLILGHSRGGEADRYGSDEARLVATTKALKLSFDLS
ncbi:tyrosine-type recombinase/integrase [Rhizobium leguminosarum]|uniref:tyrosine-type recombinase/integrase n=1 Tax=Rhizobium leguminosarum TaxID=384 RepID=UPI001C94F633|nr:tyrosine-type recombinase/integrase [Rhizobium leguminosarum]MBY5592276.1 tyrosine-type recombinase/integrase [Rhizobium leguminosarum]MBY5606111.1 tyrosine-type recombinase/integrase [Rhizobium leguminosarum]